MTLTNDVAELSGAVNLTSADVRLDTDGRDCTFKYEMQFRKKVAECPVVDPGVFRVEGGGGQT